MWRMSLGLMSAPAPTSVREQSTRHDDNHMRRLAKGEIVSLARRRACVLKCLGGVLWITDAGPHGDIIIRDGEEWVLAANDLTVIEAVEDSLIDLADSPASMDTVS